MFLSQIKLVENFQENVCGKDIDLGNSFDKVMVSEKKIRVTKRRKERKIIVLIIFFYTVE